MTNYPLPRDMVRKGNYPFKFKIKKDQSVESGWSLNEPFISKWLEINENGKITVKANEKGYSWDGCSPKKSFFNLFIFGTPDGHIDYRTNLPFTHDASLFHDALYQYLDSVPIPKKRLINCF